MNAYANDDLVRDLTSGLVARGHRVFQIFKTGADDEHARELLRIFDLPPGAYVLDAGCGIGEVARLMKEARPDLDFALLNISLAQLTMCPEGFPKVRASFEAVPLPCASFDGIMFNYSLGHGDPGKAFAEAARLLRPGGAVLVYDLAGDREVLGYQVRPAATVLDAAESRGLMATTVEAPEANADAFMTVMDGEDFGAMFEGITPIVYRFVKC